MQFFSYCVGTIDLQGVITSLPGQLSIAALSIVLFFALTTMGKGQKKMDIKILTYSAMAITVSLVLSQIKIIQMPQGGSMRPFSMFLLLTIGYLYGLKAGVIVGVVFGLMKLMFGGWVMHPLQLLLDYPVAYGALGLSGLFVGQKNGLVKGIVAGAMGRVFFHFLSGVIFFSSYAPEGWNPFIHSLWYNFSYVGVEGLMTAVIAAAPPVQNAFERIKKIALAN